jgi:hypothetical protein
MSTTQQLQEKLNKVLRLSRDKSTTEHERDTAKQQAAKLRRELDELRNKNVSDVDYHRWVKDGQIAAKQQEDSSWRLGELASRVEGKYGEGRLEQYAKDISVNINSLYQYRRVYIAWQDDENCRRLQFSIKQALTSIKNKEKRTEIATKVSTERQARDEVKKYKEQQKQKKQAKKKSKANGKDKPQPSPPTIISQGAKTLAEIFDSWLVQDDSVYQRMDKLDHNEDERKLILTALKDLQQRLNTVIRRYSKSEEE